MPDDSIDEAQSSRPARRRTISVRALMITIAALAVVFSLVVRFSYMVSDAIEAARRSQCVSHLKWIGVALLNYHETYGAFPPAYVVDRAGRPLYSWRVLLAAYLEPTVGGTTSLASGFHFDEPWDSPANRKFHGDRPRWLQCPSHLEHDQDDLTSYVVVIGSETLFPPNGASRKLTDVVDGTDRSLMLVETDNTAIHWMEPRDLDWNAMSFRINDRQRPGLASVHDSGGRGMANICTVNARVGRIRADVPPETLRALLTIRGGEVIEPSEAIFSLGLDD